MSMTPEYYEHDMQALREQRDDLLCAAKSVHDTFVKDEAQGYRSRDRRYAIDILGAAITKAEARQ